MSFELSTTATPAHDNAGGKHWHKHSNVSWTSVLAGSVIIIAVSVMLMFFGAGVGLSSVSPWSQQGLEVGGFTALAAIWLIVMQWISSGIGGYIVGRLRCRWKHIPPA